MKRHSLLLIILLVYCIFASYKLDIRVVEDEALLSVPAYTLLTRGQMAMPVFPGIETGCDKATLIFPLEFLLLAGVYKALGVSIVSGRLLSVFFGCIVIIFTYLLAGYLYNSKIALFACAITATDNFIFLTSRTIRPEIVLAAFLLISFSITVKALKNNSNYLFFGSGFFIGLGGLVHQNAIIGMAAFLLIFIFNYGLRRVFRKEVGFFVLGVFIAVVPFLIYLFLIIYPDKTSYIFGQYQIEKRVFSLFSPNWLVYSFKGEILKRYADLLAFPYRIHVIAAAVFALVYSLINRNKSNQYLLIMVFTWIVSFWLFIAVKNVRYVVAFIPFLSILISSSIFICIEKSAFAYKKLIIYFILFVLILSQVAGNMLFLYKYRDSGYYAFIDKLKQVIPQGASIYGPVTYWMGLNGYKYFAYEGVPFRTAKDTYRANVYILGSRELSSNLGQYDWAHVRRKALKEQMDSYFMNHGKLLGVVNNEFYGQVRIYSTDS